AGVVRPREPADGAAVELRRRSVRHARHDDESALVDIGKWFERRERDPLMRRDRLEWRDRSHVVAFFLAIRLDERLQRSAEVEDFELGESEKDYAVDASAPFTSFTISSVVTMRANLSRSMKSVRSKIASVGSTAPVLRFL